MRGRRATRAAPRCSLVGVADRSSGRLQPPQAAAAAPPHARHRAPRPSRGALSWPALVAAGWPDERILPRAARNRIHVALSRLRRLGLGPWLVHVPDGWMLSPALDIELSEAPAS